MSAHPWSAEKPAPPTWHFAIVEAEARRSRSDIEYPRELRIRTPYGAYVDVAALLDDENEGGES